MLNLTSFFLTHPQIEINSFLKTNPFRFFRVRFTLFCVVRLHNRKKKHNIIWKSNAPLQIYAKVYGDAQK